jgi:bile acid:Na+ symporter, BASS family
MELLSKAVSIIMLTFVVLPFLLQGVSVDPLEIARSLVLLMLLPRAAGLVLNSRLQRFAQRVRGPLNHISSVSLALLIVLLLVTDARNGIALYGTRGVLASVLFLLGGAGMGWLVGGQASAQKVCLP